MASEDLVKMARGTGEDAEGADSDVDQSGFGITNFLLGRDRFVPTFSFHING